MDKVLEEQAVVRDQIEENVKQGIKEEFKIILDKLKQHTDVITALDPRPELQWKKVVKFDLDAQDQDGCTIPMDRRGAGVRRLLMVAFFQYLAERGIPKATSRGYVFAIEEPETFLHPTAQRELCRSLTAIAARSTQVLMTTHFPLVRG